MKKLLLLCASTAALGALSPAAFSGDASAYANPFDGFYIGVHAGYSKGTSSDDGGFDLVDVEFGGIGGTFDMPLDGYLLGAQAGYNKVMHGGFMFGAEVSGSYAAMNGSVGKEWVTGGYDVEFGGATQSMGSLGMAEAKLGYATDMFAIYAKGGLALGRLDQSYWADGSLGRGYYNAEFGDSTLRTGWTVGAGADVMLSDHTSLGISYNYVDYGTMETSGVGTANVYDVEFAGSVPTLYSKDVKLTDSIVKINLDYHF
jgi:opacity protein-like surface antigen